MKLQIITSSLILVALSIIALLIRFGFFQPPLSADVPRKWAESEYNRIFSDPMVAIPTLASSTNSVPMKVEHSDSNQIKISRVAFEPEVEFHTTGVRVNANSAQEVELANGVKIKLIGVALVRAQIENPSKRSNQGKSSIKWFDPVDQKPIPDPEKRGLKPTFEGDLTLNKLLLAFVRTDDLDEPVRWHIPKLKNSITKTDISNQTWHPTPGEKVKIYTHVCWLYSKTSLDIALPISYGKPETRIVDIGAAKPNDRIRFSENSTELTLLYKKDSRITTTSWDSDHNYEYEWNDESTKDHSFALFRVYPVIHSKLMEWKCGSSIGDFYDSIEGLRFNSNLIQLEPLEITHYQNLAHCIFHIENIADLLPTKDLLKLECGPIQFDYSGEIKTFFNNVTATSRLRVHRQFDESEFPLYYPQITPGELLKEINSRAGTKQKLNRKTFKIEQPIGLAQRIKDFIELYRP